MLKKPTTSGEKNVKQYLYSLTNNHRIITISISFG